MKDYNFSAAKTKSDAGSLKGPSVNLLPGFSKILIIICGIGLVVLVFIQIPSFLVSPVRSIGVRGNEILTEERIIEQLNIDKEHSWIGLDPFQLSLNLKKNPWVDKAIVHRSFPLKLDVRITERQPIAYLKTRDRLFLMAKGYRVLETMPSAKVWNLPVIVNLDLQKIEVGDMVEGAAMKKAVELIDILADNKVLPLDAVSEIIVTNPFNIELITIPYGIKIKLGFQNFEKKLAKLNHVLPKIEWQRQNIKYLDLRTVQGVVMKKRG
jgi:cell division septal protein FtsQ